MSLLSALHVGSNALIANQLGLRVAGNNIANANTPGYIRQEMVVSPAVSQRLGNSEVGLGVEVLGIVQKVDRFVEERLRNAISDVGNGETQEGVYLELERVIGELNDSDLSTSMTRFFNSIQNVLNQPESVPLRNIVVQEGARLADSFQDLERRVRVLRDDVNDRVLDSVDSINKLLTEVADLNQKIIQIEVGGTGFSEAVGLRDKRGVALQQLSELMGIQSIEQENGSISVFLEGDFLVQDGFARQLTTNTKPVGGVTAYTVELADNHAKVEPPSGRLAGLLTSRDQILGGFLGGYNEFVKSFAFEFNKVFSGGQGLTGFTQVTSGQTVLDPERPLDAAGLPFSPVNGSFQLLVRNRETQQVQTHDLSIHLNGLDSDSSLSDVATAISGVDGLTAEVTQANKLSIATDEPTLEFAFSNDTSGFLAALGINTFFAGSTAGDIRINSAVSDDPSKFASSKNGIGVDAENLIDLAKFSEAGIESQNGLSITEMYEELVTQTTQSSAVSQSIVEGYRNYKSTIESQHLAVSGVSLDEEAINMISYQRSYQASARFVQTINELLEILVNL